MSSVASFSALCLAHLHFLAEYIYIIIPFLKNEPVLAYESASVLEKAVYKQIGELTDLLSLFLKSLSKHP